MDKIMVELGDEKWLWDVALLYDINHHLNMKLTSISVF
jgi:hypothetical protein